MEKKKQESIEDKLNAAAVGRADTVMRHILEKVLQLRPEFMEEEHYYRLLCRASDFEDGFGVAYEELQLDIAESIVDAVIEESLDYALERMRCLFELPKIRRPKKDVDRPSQHEINVKAESIVESSKNLCVAVREALEPGTGLYRRSRLDALLMRVFELWKVKHM